MSKREKQTESTHEDFHWREHYNRLKAMIDSLSLGVLDTMSEEEQEEFFANLQKNLSDLDSYVTQYMLMQNITRK